MSSITPTCQEAFMINLSRVTSLQNRPSTCWKEKKKSNANQILAVSREQMPKPFFLLCRAARIACLLLAKVVRDQGHLAQNKVFGSFGLSLEVTVKDGLGWTNRVFGLRALDFLLFWAIFSPGKRKTISLV